MHRSSTPTFTINLATDVQACDEIILTFKQQGEIKLEKHRSDLEIEGSKISYTMTQEESRAFKARRPVSMQAELKTGGKVVYTQIMTVFVEPVLNDEVI